MKKNAFWICSGIVFCLFSYLLGCSGGGSGGGDGPGPLVTHAVSGTIFAANNSVIDSDVNDVFAEYNSNDTFAEAQAVPNPAILGGYVNMPGTGWVGDLGEVGRSYVDGDLKDYFSVTLTTNQSITLYISDFSESQADIDLYLYDENETMVDSSIGTESTETVDASTAGDYYIEVRAFSGASNYIFTVGQPITSATLIDPRMNEEFAPGHVIVAFHENAETTKQVSKSLAPTPFHGMKHTALKHGNMRLYSFTSENTHQVFNALNISPMETNRALYQANNEEEQFKLDTLRVIDALNKEPDVRYAEPNYIRRPLFVPNDANYSKQWHYPMINLPQAWDVTKGSSDVIVAVIDTGILSGHPDLIGQLSPDGYDFISLESVSQDGTNGIDDDPEDVGDETQGGSSFHGTHVAGTIAAATDNTIGVAGIAFQSKIMALRALGVGGGLGSDILQAMLYAAGLDNDSNTTPAQKADIINMSLGGGSFSQAEQDVVDLVRAENVIIIAAAGNEDTSVPSYPAAYDGVVSVSAVGPEKQLAPYSNFGTSIDIAAPGGDLAKDINNDSIGDGVLSTSGDDSSQNDEIENVYSYYQGTSMACPHVAGVVALMKSLDPTMSPLDLDTLISQGVVTEDLAGNGPTIRDNSFGYGLIDAYKAVQAAADPSQIPSFLLVNPLSLNFGNSTVDKTLTVSKSNDNALSVQSFSDDADWLVVTETSVDGEGMGTYTVTVDRTGLPDGPYYATISFVSSENTVDIPVTMFEGVVTVAGDSGFHYVLLLDANTYQARYQDEVSVFNGAYSYSFPSVAEGSYIVFAGTDSDNDLYIGDSGESIGAYISLDQPQIISVDQDLSGINFNTSFNLDLPTSLSTDNGKKESGLRRLE
jgi:serine protease